MNRSTKKQHTDYSNTRDMLDTTELGTESNDISERYDVLGDSRQTIVLPKNSLNIDGNADRVLFGISEEGSSIPSKMVFGRNSLGKDLSFVLDARNNVRKLRESNAITEERNTISRFIQPNDRILRELDAQFDFADDHFMRKIRTDEWKGLSFDESAITKYNIRSVVVNNNQVRADRQFLTKQVPQNKIVFCKFIRDKDGLNILSPAYHMYTEEGAYLATVKKRTGNMTSNYLISADKNDLSTSGKNYIGKVRSNFGGSVFNVFDQGLNPTSEKVISDRATCRQLVATIVYTQQAFFSNSPRQLAVYLLNQGVNYQDLRGVEQNKEEINLGELYQIQENKNKIMKLVNKRPTWNKEDKKYELDFRGKMEIESIKNMIISKAQNSKEEVLLFAKRGPNQFHLEFCNPLSPRVVMGILASSFDFKWTLE